MTLTATAVRNVKPKTKSFKLTDGKGMYLLVNPNGSKYWRQKYRFHGKEKLLSLGVYPDISLSNAREKRDSARKLLLDGIDPNIFKQTLKRTTEESDSNTFEITARKWHMKFSQKWSADHGEKILRRLERDVFPWIGDKSISKLKAPELLTIIQRIENRGALDTAHRALQNCGQIYSYAIASGFADRDPSAALKKALPPVRPKHHASITEPRKAGSLLRTIDAYQGYFVTKCALSLAPLLFVRPGELRHAEWSEINTDTAEWRIPAKKMKMKELHIVPLSLQSMKILEELHTLTGRGKYVFPGIRSASRPMSENTINGALRRLGYTKDEMTGHGFRSMASTLLNEQGVNRDWIERQLAHSERDSIRAAYNYADYLPERKNMMQQWADYLDSLRNEKVVATDNF